MWARRRPLIAACLSVVVGLVVLVAGVLLDDDDDAVQVHTGTPSTLGPATNAPTTATSSTTTSSSSTTSTTRPRPTTTSMPATTTPPATMAATGNALREGQSGPEVADLQRRLVALGYWLGAVDGAYGSSTTHAVVAFQKASALQRDGVAGQATLDRLATAVRLQAKSASGRVIEVDLERQLLLVVLDGRVEQVMDASTGALAGTTPAGRFAVYYEVDGYDPGPLGVLYRPKYFIRGVAVHGYPNVPATPASHGCVRVTDAGMDWLWASGVMVMETPVWVY